MENSKDLPQMIFESDLTSEHFKCKCDIQLFQINVELFVSLIKHIKYHLVLSMFFE